jgi:hypothetical protein
VLVNSWHYLRKTIDKDQQAHQQEHEPEYGQVHQVVYVSMLNKHVFVLEVPYPSPRLSRRAFLAVSCLSRPTRRSHPTSPFSQRLSRMPVVHHSSCFAQPSLPASFAPPSSPRWRTSRPTNVGLASRSNSQRASRPACLASPILPRTYSGRDARSRPPHPSVVLISFISNTAGAYMARDNARRRYGAGLLGGPRARGGGWGVGANVLMWQRTKTGM